MKKTRQFNSRIIVAALCLAVPGLMNLKAQIVPNAPTQPEVPQKTETTTAPGQPMKVNKCSQLIGTEVQNPRGERLGIIEDLVVDYNSGRVSYCVLSVGRGAFATPKYLAVPLTAMRPSADGVDLILNADRAKLAEAQGFDRGHWPPVSNPVWGAQTPWQTPPVAPSMAPSSHGLPRVQ